MVPKQPAGPTNKEMRADLYAHVLKHHPERLCTKIVKMFYERGWEVIFTPPYCPDLQPAEKVWAQVKGRVGRNYRCVSADF